LLSSALSRSVIARCRRSRQCDVLLDAIPLFYSLPHAPPAHPADQRL
jgi:hypothetical protein